ncbi:hypothetical protein ABPG77_000305, partial [Micractinium sp. CCAP 211/92]
TAGPAVLQHQCTICSIDFWSGYGARCGSFRTSEPRPGNHAGHRLGRPVCCALNGLQKGGHARVQHIPIPVHPAGLCHPGARIKTNLYNADIWRFVGAFLMMRAIMLVACAFVFGLLLRRSLGEVTANWLCTTWISTVILGVPLLQALLGPAYANLGVHTWREENLRGRLPQVLPSSTPGAQSGDGGKAEAGTGPDARSLGRAPSASSQRAHPQSAEDGGQGVCSPEGRRRSQACRQPTPRPCLPAGGSAASAWEGLAGKLLGCLNFRIDAEAGPAPRATPADESRPVGRGIGLILSLSTLGYKYLDPGSPPACPNCRYAWRWLHLHPARLLCALHGAGRLLCHRDVDGTPQPHRHRLDPGRSVHDCQAHTGADAYGRLLLCGGPRGAYARAAVLVATLPVSAAAFALSKTYNVGDDVAAVNVFLGNLLILPTNIAWVSAMDGMGLFPASYSKLPPSCSPCT